MTPGKLITTARRYRYVREVQPNSSPEIDSWLRAVGCKPGDSWCAAFVCGVIHETDPGFAFTPSASALHLLANNPHLIVTDPQPGDVVVEDHGHGLGHCGIVTGTTHQDGKLTDLVSIAGNTSADGASRNGDRVAEHEISLDRVAGYIRVCSQPEELTSPRINPTTPRQVVRACAQPFPGDASIWKIPVLSSDPLLGTVNLKMTLTEGGTGRVLVVAQQPGFVLRVR